MEKIVRAKGFTLVEVVVVAVIVLVLAAVAIPLYSGYVMDSRQAVIENEASEIASFLGTVVETGGRLEAYRDERKRLTLTTAWAVPTCFR